MSWMIALSLAASTSLAQADAPRLEVLRTAGQGWGGIEGRAEQVRLHIETESSEVELFRITGEGVGTVATSRGAAAVGIVEYERECFAPCDTLIPMPRSDFFIAGSGIPASQRFSLLGRGEDITLRVKPGNSALRFLGWTSTALGASALALGAIVLLVEGMGSGGVPSIGSPSLAGDKLLPWAAIGGGAALLGAGIPLIAFSGTHVEFLPGKPAALTGREDL